MHLNAILECLLLKVQINAISRVFRVENVNSYELFFSNLFFCCWIYVLRQKVLFKALWKVCGFLYCFLYPTGFPETRFPFWP